ncbi:rho guanine nucleotide exchange factor 1 isoform X2 [Amia ocellicauda]|uniref:rho guanine nucleotide exchange factor 1 isoform X2 n=1 Tax=Amia ocellicauda TaxID=2972642 RepID=UPI00346393E8
MDCDDHEGRFGASRTNPALNIIGAEDEDFENDIDPTVDDSSSAFNSIELLKSRPAHLLVFLQHVMLQFDCAPVLCFLHAEIYKNLSAKELKKQFVDFYNSFLDKGAVLRVPVPYNVSYELDRTRPDLLPEDSQRRFVQEIQNMHGAEVLRQLDDFRQKRMMGMTPCESELLEVEEWERTGDRLVQESRERGMAEQLLERLAEIHPTICSDEDRCSAMFTAVVSYMKHLGVKTKTDSKKSRGFFRKKLPGIKKPADDSSSSSSFSKHKQPFPKILTDTARWISGGNEHRASKSESEGDKDKSSQDKKVNNGPPSRTPPDRPEHPPTGGRKLGVPAPPTGSDGSDGSGVTISVTSSSDSVHSEVTISRSDSLSPSESIDPSVRGGGTSPWELPPPSDTPSEDSQDWERLAVRLGRSESLCVDRRRSVRNSGRAKQSRSRSDVDIQAATTATGHPPPSPGSPAHPPKRHTASSDSVVMQGEVVQSPNTAVTTEEVDPRAAELEQDPPNWRESATSNILSKLNKKETKRQEVINELFVTEHAHVRMLSVLQSVFFKPLEREQIMTLTELQAIFPSLDEIIDMHYSFCESLKKLRQEQHFIVRELGQTLLNRFSGTEGEWFQKLSARFCSHQTYALDQIKARQKKDARFNTFILEAESKPQCRRLQLKDIIPIEMQRLTKYPLLLENIAKSTEDEKERKNVHQAAECCRKILNHVNEEVKTMENLLTLKDYQRRLDVSGLKTSNDLLAEYKNIDLTQRRMIYEGQLTWRVTKEKAIEVQALLLSDMLVLLQRQDDRMLLKVQSKSNVSIPEGKQMLSPIIKLGSVFLRDVATDRKAFYVIFTWESGAQIYELVAQTVSDMKNWTELIMDAVSELKQSGTLIPSLDRKRSTTMAPSGANFPQSPTLTHPPLSPSENGGGPLKDHLSNTDRDKDNLSDSKPGEPSLLADFLTTQGIKTLHRAHTSQEKIANGALKEVLSLKRLLVRSISVSEESQPPTTSQNAPGGEEEKPDVAAAEDRTGAAGGGEEGQKSDWEDSISAPLVLTQDQATDVRQHLANLEQQLRQLQSVEENFQRLQEYVSKSSFSPQF